MGCYHLWKYTSCVDDILVNRLLLNWFGISQRSPVQDPVIRCQLCQSHILDICLTTRGCLTSTHTPSRLAICPLSRGQLARGRHFLWARGATDGKTDEAKRGTSQSDVTDENRKLWNWMITGLSVFRVCCLLVLLPLWCLLVTPEALGQLPEFTWKKKKTPPALSLNTWWPNQFQSSFAYIYIIHKLLSYCCSHWL